MFTATVIAGDGIGRTLGYPTANLDITPYDAGMADGVYVSHTTITSTGVFYPSALVVNRARRRVEVFLIGYSGDLYGETLEVTPGEWVSDIEEFSTVDNLVKKMDHDLELIHQALEAKT